MCSEVIEAEIVVPCLSHVWVTKPALIDFGIFHSLFWTFIPSAFEQSVRQDVSKWWTKKLILLSYINSFQNLCNGSSSKVLSFISACHYFILLQQSLFLYFCINQLITLHLLPVWSEWLSEFHGTGFPGIAVQSAVPQGTAGTFVWTASTPRSRLWPTFLHMTPVCSKYMEKTVTMKHLYVITYILHFQRFIKW